MCDKKSIRYLPPRSAIDLLNEAEARKKKREQKHSTGTEFQEDHFR